MSEYGYEDDRRRHRSHRTRERDPEYAQETTYIERGSGAPVRDLVYRPHDEVVEDIPRNFPPPGSDYSRNRRRDAPRSTRGYDDDYYSDRGYARDPPRRSRRHDDGYYSDEHDRPRRDRRKSVGDQLKELGEGLGLGGVLGAVTGKARSRSRSRGGHGHRDRDRQHDRRGRYDSSSSRSRSRSRGGKRSAKWEQAAKAAVVAGAVEAFRSRKTPGPWTGEKGQRIATAALGAAGIDKVVGRGDKDDRSKRHIAESAIGGLVANRLANGSRSRSRGPRAQSDSRSRSRSRSRSIFGRSKSRGRDGSRSRSKIRDVAGAGAVLAAGKAIYDRVRSKSRARKDRDRSRSVSSDDSYVPSRGRRYDRQKDSEGYNDERAMTGPAAGAGAMTTNQSRARDSSASSDSTTDLETKRKKLRGKELLTAGFATVATIHAAHGVYNSMVASEKRRKLVAEGEMTPEVARKQKSKNMLQDAAAVGIAALGIKGAFSEWKEMNEQRHQCHELESKRRKRKKAKEKRDREARQQAIMFPVANPAYSAPYPQPSIYPDANPYAAGQVPPPPIGGGSVRY